MINWVFFDLGSTLVDEEECEKFRISHLLAQPGAPGREVQQRYWADWLTKNQAPYRSFAEKYGLQTCPWPSELEKLYEGVPQILQSLHKKYKLGIIANQNFGTTERLAGFGIRQYFDVIAASAEVGTAKPDPAIFMHALRMADCTPDQAVMIGDRLDNDIAPAARLGMGTIWVRQGQHACSNVCLLPRKPDAIAERIASVLDIL